MDISKTIRLLNRDPSSSGGLPPYRLLAREVPKAPHIMQAVVTAVGYTLEMGNKSLLLGHRSPL
jgi:hypothetical protein